MNDVFLGEIFGPVGGSKIVRRGPFISTKFVPRGPYFSKNLDWGVQICCDSTAFFQVLAT